MNSLPPPLLSANALLAYLPAGELQRLSTMLQPVTLEFKSTLYNVGGPIDYVYFPRSGIISAMTAMGDGRAIEVATIGNEGMSGLSALLGGGTSPYDVIVQIAGSGWRMRSDHLQQEADRNGDFRKIIMLYHDAFAVQVAYSVACNGLHTVEMRCSRWLLMTQDRIGSPELNLTHEFLSVMLGVRRATITDILNPLQRGGLLRTHRGMIEILDRPGLEAISCECYEMVKQQFGKLFPHRAAA